MVILNIVKSHTFHIGFLTSGIKYINVKMGDYDLREILKELRQMVNEVSKSSRCFQNLTRPWKNSQNWRRILKPQPKKELLSLESMETEVQTKPREPVAIGMEQKTHCRYWSYYDWAQRLSWAGARWRLSWVVNYKFANASYNSCLLTWHAIIW